MRTQLHPMNNDQKRRLYSLFSNLSDEEAARGFNRSPNSDILLVDAHNAVIRSYCAVPTLNDDGIHKGAIIGFLKTIGSAINLLNPTRVIIIFDGNGGSMKRRKLYPEYKMGRKIKELRLNRTYEELTSPDIEDKSLKSQLLRIVAYLNVLPVSTMAIDHVEADDTIAYCALDHFKNSNVTIMSADKDFLQLVDDQRVKVWSPTKKKLYGCAEIHGEYGLSCKNYINYRALEGDKSDNIPGITGAGLKTINKLFPIFTENRQYSIDEIFNYCQNNAGKYKLYNTILDNKEIVIRNYALMQLNDSQIQPLSQLKITEILDRSVSKLDRLSFSKLILEDKIRNSFPDSMIWVNDVFGRLNSSIL